MLRGSGIFLGLFYIYPIVSYAPAFVPRFLLLVTVVKGITRNVIHSSTPWYWNFLVLFYIYPIIPYASAIFVQFLVSFSEAIILCSLRKYVHVVIFFINDRIFKIHFAELISCQKTAPGSNIAWENKLFEPVSSWCQIVL